MVCIDFLSTEITFQCRSHTVLIYDNNKLLYLTVHDKVEPTILIQ